MRLKPHEIEAIKNAFRKSFGSGRIYLFGSRVDDTKKGGDIDLFIESAQTQNLSNKKVDFLAQLKREMGE